MKKTALSLVMTAAAASPVVMAGDVNVSGRLMWDYDNVSGAYTPSGDSTDELHMRRARIGVDGTFADVWSYELVLNYRNNAGSGSKSTDGLEWDTSMITYKGLENIRFDLGRMKRPMGLEQATSSKWISTISRSIIWDVAGGVSTPSQAMIKASGYHSGFGWAVYLADDGQEKANGSTRFGYGTRLHYAMTGDDNVVHLGVNYADTNPVQGGASESGSTRGNSRINKLDKTEANKFTVLKTGRTSDKDVTIALEGAYQTGPFSIQGEYMTREFDRASVDGLYIQTAYTLTGEKRKYKAAAGKFDKITPNNGTAVELVGKYEIIKGNSDVAGDTEEKVSIITAGVNVYPHKNVKFMFNVFQADVGDANKNAKNDDSGTGFRARAQYVF